MRKAGKQLFAKLEQQKSSGCTYHQKYKIREYVVWYVSKSGKLYKYLFNQINMFDFCVMNHNVIMSVFLRKIYAESNVFFSGKSTIIY